jgi:hypothetical protein
VARRPSLAWLLALAAVAGLGLVVFIAVPLRSCPTCRSLAKKLADPVTKTVPFRVNCPECGDRGTVTELRRLKGPLVSQPVSRLLQSQRGGRQADFVLKLDDVATGAGKIPGDVSGESFFPGDRSGGGVFIRSEEKPLVLIVLQGTERGPIFNRNPGSSMGLVLLGMDGRVLDYLHCSCDDAWGSMLPELLDGAADGALVEIQARSLPPEDRNIRDAKVTAHQPAGREDFPTQASARKLVRVTVKDERFEFLAPPKAAKK